MSKSGARRAHRSQQARLDPAVRRRFQRRLLKWYGEFVRRRFQRRLLKWYGEFGRDLPWRQTSDPYRILVSEVMLQQTQVERVIPKYHEFLERYPTFKDLAGASPEDVRKTWYPLGYNIRPLRLHSIACETVARYGGSLPSTSEDLLSFKGIGRYTAGAIRSFAFREDAPILDTNVMRVLHRIFVGHGDPKKQKNKLWALSEELIPKGKGYDFNQALMDFGAMLCTAREPYCLLCPMKDFCKTYPFEPTRRNKVTAEVKGGPKAFKETSSASTWTQA